MPETAEKEEAKAVFQSVRLKKRRISGLSLGSVGPFLAYFGLVLKLDLHEINQLATTGRL